jgi:hypothetical protein
VQGPSDPHYLDGDSDGVRETTTIKGKTKGGAARRMI